MSIFLLIINKIRNLPSQPCCGYFLHGGTRVVGLLDFGLSLFAIILIGSEMYQKFGELIELYTRMEYVKYYFRAASWVGYISFKVLLMGLSILLFRATRKRSPRLCKLWMVLTVVISVLLFILFYINHFLFHISLTIHVFGVIYILYKLYCLRVVALYTKELESYGGFNAALSGLTDVEVEEFEKGCPPDKTGGEGLLIQNQAFNRDFEISHEDLEIDESSLLGSGAFGCVYRGRLRKGSDIKSVAIKTVSQNADIAYFKTLLAELKVMTYVSTHENIVSLVGACTASIKQKKLYIVVEFCPYGNLHEYLKARRGLFLNLVKDGEFRRDLMDSGTGYTNVSSNNTVSTVDIMKWLYETCKGLQFLEEKKVIHGDIAARNILLGYGKIAKVSDFGLSKKLYQYTTVVKEATLLPWRWMALESLSDMEFSSKSDVWSFGTTMWEAFSLSELPFPGFSWDKDFVNKIREGLRMNQPRNATKEMYNLMLSCWKPNPKDRPTFKEVREELERMLREACLLTGISETQENDNSDRSDPTAKINANNLNEPDEIEIYIPHKASVDHSIEEVSDDYYN